jgi:methionyl-tRNA formyltransferase
MLRNNEKYGGVSLHVVTEKIDAGAILAQDRIPIASRDDVATLETQTNKALMELLDRHLLPILQKTVVPMPNNSEAGDCTPAIRNRQRFLFTDDPVFIYNSIGSQAVHGGCIVQQNGNTIEITDAYLDCYEARRDILQRFTESKQNEVGGATRFMSATMWQQIKKVSAGVG